MYVCVSVCVCKYAPGYCAGSHSAVADVLVLTRTKYRIFPLEGGLKSTSMACTVLHTQAHARTCAQTHTRTQTDTQQWKYQVASLLVWGGLETDDNDNYSSSSSSSSYSSYDSYDSYESYDSYDSGECPRTSKPCSYT